LEEKQNPLEKDKHMHKQREDDKLLVKPVSLQISGMKFNLTKEKKTDNKEKNSM
jgi:hypothetical protein